MKRILIALGIAVMVLVQPAFAEERASLEEAKAMALEAAEFVANEGHEAASEAFQTPGGEWHDRDLYVFAMDDQGIMWAHGVKLELVGQDLSDLVDVSGRFFIRDFMAIETEGWVDYLWENPVTGEIELKSSYIVRVLEGDIVGVGAYKE